MPRGIPSLLAGRNQNPLSDQEVQRIITIFLGMDDGINVRHDAACVTAFVVAQDQDGRDYVEIVFGPDILPGLGVVDPNSALRSNAAAAHELTHYHRWRDRLELPEGDLDYLDEALTSLQAILRYEKQLSQHDVRQLVSDALQRIQLYFNR
jgi:hypothetical protein